MNAEFKVPNELAEELVEFGEIEKGFLDLWCAVLNAYGGALYPLDLYVQGAVKRTLSQTHAIKLLLESCNLMSARALLRMQIDTAMRLHAAWLAPDPHKFVRQVMDGKRICQLKDRKGNMMTDAYLARNLTEKHEWLHRVYEHTSGYVHLSDSQFYMSVELSGDSEELAFTLATTDSHMPVDSFVEVAQCFKEATRIVFDYVHGWYHTKSNPEIAAKIWKEENS